MKTLEEVRAGWEKNSDLIGECTLKSGTVIAVIAPKRQVLGRPRSQDVLRYFQIAGNWEVSCDYRGHDQDEVTKKLLELMSKDL